MNDEETVALIAGGHTFGKGHGAASAEENVGADPEAAGIEAQGFGWANKHGKGHGADTISSGLEGAWTTTPAEWSHDYFEHMYNYEWEKSKSPAGAIVWRPKNGDGEDSVPDAHDDSKSHAPIMYTSDLALRMDPIYGPISKRFFENPDQFKAAFAKAWYKLIHRDMGPMSRYLGDDIPEPQLWQDPIPKVDHELIDDGDISSLKDKLLNSDLTVSQLVSTAWSSAASFRGSDKRGGANGARLRLAPQKDWAVNEPAALAKVLPVFEKIQKEFNDAQAGDKKVSLADLIVLGGCAAIYRQSSVLARPRRHNARTNGCRIFRRPRTHRGRIPKLLGQTRLSHRRRTAHRSGSTANADRTRDDRFGRWHASFECQRWSVKGRCFNQPSRPVDERLFCQLVRHENQVAQIKRRRCIPRSRSRNRRREMGGFAS